MLKKGSLVKKELAAVVILLFVGVAFAPGFTAEIPTVSDGDSKLVEIAVYEIKSDGSREKTIVEMSSEYATELQEKLRDAKDFEEQLLIYKDYGLIPQNITLEILRAGMEEKMRQMNVTRAELEEIANASVSDDDAFGMNLMCEVSGGIILAVKLFIGSSIFTNLINMLLFDFYYPPLLSIDFFDKFFGLIGDMDMTNGLSDDCDCDGWFVFMRLAGFVGYMTSV